MLTDIQMPGPVDGNVVAMKAKQHHPGVPVIYASGRPQSLKNKVEQPDVFVSKPYTAGTMTTIVKRLLSGI